MPAGKKILIGITGSIAAYKVILLTRLLVKAGAEVKIIMTPAAKEFVSPLTLSTLSHHLVLTDLATEGSWANHVMLGRWADVFLLAPLSCNTLAKMAAGLCDNLLMATYLSATCPVVVAPAMDEDMWHHQSTTRNLEIIRSWQNLVIPVGHGELASGLTGDGRMAEPETIFEFLSALLNESKDLKNKQVLVTAGPTFEPIDPVRFIGNRSSGKMGIALATELSRRGATVQLILGPVATMNGLPSSVNVFHVQTAAEMFEKCAALFPAMDVAVMAAAVADYEAVNVQPEKIKKKEGNLVIEFAKTKDILKHLGSTKKAGQILVGFALETTNEKEHALQKLHSKHADMIVLNSIRDNGAGFGHDTNQVTIFEKDGNETRFEKKPKQQVAKDIVDKIVNLLHV